MNNQSQPPTSENLIYLLLHTARSVESRMEEVLGEVGLSGPKFAALCKLTEGPLSLSELAAQLTCVRSNVTQLVDRLELDGLVRRVNDRQDRRSIRAEATAEGRERQAEGLIRMQKLQKEFAQALGDVDLEQLAKGLCTLKGSE